MLSWTERQGQVGDLRNRSKEELVELLHRQEIILSNKRLLSSLPDKGKKIQEFAERVRRAIQYQHEEEKRRSLATAAGTELQSKYQRAFTVRQRVGPSAPAGAQTSTQSEAAAIDAVQEGLSSARPSAEVQGKTRLDENQGHSVSSEVSGETMETMAAGASLNSDVTKEGDLVEALERVTLSERGAGLRAEPRHPGERTEREKYLSPSKPHYVAVLERTEKTPEHRRQKFKTNQIPDRGSGSLSESSASQSLEGSLLLSAEARRERDRKHLDDITAAKLPPLHHTPAQLLTLEESAVLLKEQTKKQQELQAKLAAQKLSEGLKLSMGSYTLDSGPMAAYREVHVEGAQLSSEEEED